MKRLNISPTLVWFSLVIVLFWASLYVYVPILPVYAASLQGGSVASAGLVVSMYGLTQFLLRIPLGIGSDRLNARKGFIYLGFGLAACAALGLGFTGTVTGAAAFRGLSGAAASMWVILTTLFASFYPQNAAVRATSLAVFLSVIAQMAASLSGGVIAQNFGVRAAFLTAAGLALAGLLLLPVSKQQGRANKTPDSAAGQGSFQIGWYLILVSAAAAVTQFIAYATTYGYMPILADTMGASAAQLGRLTATMQFAYMTTTLLVSFVIPDGHEKSVALTGIAIVGLACLLVLMTHSVGALFVISFLQGIGHGLSYPVLMGLAIKPVQNHRRATAMGFFQAVYALGMFAGPAVSGWISARAGLPAVFSTSGTLALVALPVLFFGLRGKL